MSKRRALVGLLRAAWTEYERDYARFFAAAMVYYALVSLIPLLLLLLAGLGLLLRFADFAAAAEQQVLNTVETTFGAEVRETIDQLSDRLQQESITATFVSLVGLLLTASVLFRQLRLSFRAIWKYAPPLVSGSVQAVVRTTVLEQVISFVMVLTGGLLLLVALALIAMIQSLSGLFGNLPRVGETTAWLVALPIPLAIVTLTFALLFKFLPPVRLHWRHVWLAAVLCGVAWFIGAEILALYGASFGSSGSAHGAIGGLLMIMFWMNVVSQMLFYGAEVCKAVHSRESH